MKKNFILFILSLFVFNGFSQEKNTTSIKKTDYTE